VPLPNPIRVSRRRLSAGGRSARHASSKSPFIQRLRVRPAEVVPAERCGADASLSDVCRLHWPGGSPACSPAMHRGSRKLAVQQSLFGGFGIELCVSWGATAPTRHALRTSVSPQWVRRRSDFHEIVATVARFVGRSRFVTTGNTSLHSRVVRRGSLSDGDGEPTAHYAVCKPFSSNADDVSARDRFIRRSGLFELRPT
jgi:hypothetical protein